MGQRSGATNVSSHQFVEFALKFRVCLGGDEGGFELDQGGHERFGHELPAVGAELGG
jgi:hypothetical protein